MTKNPTVIAILTTVLFAGTVGVLAAVGAFGVLRVGEEVLEALGFLRGRWGEDNVLLMLQLAGFASIPLVLLLSVWFYRKALNAERVLLAQSQNPPAP